MRVLSRGGGGGGGVESALSGRGENTFGRLGESAGARLRGRGESAEALRAWRAWWCRDSEGLEGAWSPGCVQYAHARCGRRGRGRRARVSSAASDRALACGSRARSEALARGVQGAYSTHMRSAVGVGEAAARECRVQRAIEHSRVAVERGVKHS